MQSTRQVFFNSDARGIVLLSVAVYSLLKSSDPTKELTVYVAYAVDFREQGCCERLAAIVARFPFAHLVFLDFDPVMRQFPDLFGSELRNWGPLLWAFPLCTEMLPSSVHGNIVYIDLDTLTRKDLGPLFDLPLAERGYLAAGVNESARADSPYLFNADWPESAGDYLNNGVLVIDIDAYRREDMGRQMREWFVKHRTIARCVEQDAQNCLLGSRTLRLPPRWNYRDSWLERVLHFAPWRRFWWLHPRTEVLEAILDPAIIHFIGRHKPTRRTHRPERHIHRAAMRELGLMKGRLPDGQGWKEAFEGALFDCYHALLRLYVRVLLGLTRS